MVEKFSGTLNVRTAFRAPEKGRRTAHSYKRTRTVPPFSATGRAYLRRKAYALCPSFGLDTFCLVPTAWKFRTDWMKPSLAGNGAGTRQQRKKGEVPWDCKAKCRRTMPRSGGITVVRHFHRLSVYTPPVLQVDSSPPACIRRYKCNPLHRCG